MKNKETLFSFVLLGIFVAGLLYTFSIPTKSKVDTYVSAKLNWNENSIQKDPDGFMHYLVKRQHKKIEDLAAAEFKFRTNNEILQKRIKAAEIRYNWHKGKFEAEKLKYLDIKSKSDNDPDNASLLGKKVAAERAFKRTAGKLKTEANLFKSASSLLERNNKVLHQTSMRGIAEAQLLAEIKSSQEISKLNSLTNNSSISNYAEQDEFIASAKILGEMLEESFAENNELIGSIHGLEMDSDAFLEEILDDDFASKDVANFYTLESSKASDHRKQQVLQVPLTDTNAIVSLPDLDNFVISYPETTN